LIAVIGGALSSLLYNGSVASEEQYRQTLGGYLTMYVIAVGSTLFYGIDSEFRADVQRKYMHIFWVFVRAPYWITCCITIIYLIDLDYEVGTVLIYSGYLTLACALMSVFAWLLRRRHTAS
jgi:uncharacterized protein (TIGR03382 family)